MPVEQRGDRGADHTINIAARRLKTAVGVLSIVASDDSVLYIELPGSREGSFERWLFRRPETPALRAALTELREYFAGKRRRFDVPVEPAGTEFQQQVWKAIAAIPFGKTIAYGEIAEQLGGPDLSRAVGAATGANPIPIIIPCHRVIGADGSMTGYGGGLRMKVWLLRHEGALLA